MEIISKIVDFITDMAIGGMETAGKFADWFDGLETNVRFLVFLSAFAIPFYFVLLTHNKIITVWVSLVLSIRIIGLVQNQFFSGFKRLTLPDNVESVVPDKVEPRGFVVNSLDDK